MLQIQIQIATSQTVCVINSHGLILGKSEKALRINFKFCDSKGAVDDVIDTPFHSHSISLLPIRNSENSTARLENHEGWRCHQLDDSSNRYLLALRSVSSSPMMIMATPLTIIASMCTTSTHNYYYCMWCVEAFIPWVETFVSVKSTTIITKIGTPWKLSIIIIIKVVWGPLCNIILFTTPTLHCTTLIDKQGTWTRSRHCVSISCCQYSPGARNSGITTTGTHIMAREPTTHTCI